MANATPAPKIRAKNTQSVLNANGTTDSITWIREATVIKRLRRALAKKNHKLLITREHTPARRELGSFAVLGADGEVLQRDAELEALARYLSVLAADEMIDPPAYRGWRHYVGKVETVIVDGVEASYARPISRAYMLRPARLYSFKELCFV